MCDFCSRYSIAKENDSKIPKTVFREYYCALETIYADDKNHFYEMTRSPVYPLNFCPVCGTVLNDKLESAESVKGNENG